MASDDPGTTIQLGDHSKLLKVPVAQVYILQVASIGGMLLPPEKLDTSEVIVISGPKLP